MSKTKRVLIVDQLNLFFRNYIVNPSISNNGAPIGGLRGCLQSLQKVMRESKPDMVVICWDGHGGSKKRKTIKKDYKAGRKPIRLNRGIRNLSEEEEIDNKIWQQTRLVDYYNQLPIVQFMFDGIEADDIIAAVAKHKALTEYDKIILSSDKDFFQLCDDETVIYRPIQKKVVNRNTILDEYKIHPINFALARAIVGDKSDNLAGVPGVGLATVSKRFPFLKEEKEYYIQDIIDECNNNAESKLKLYTNVAENENLIKDNYKIMQLSAPSISIQTKSKINTTFDNYVPEYNKTLMLSKMIKDGLGEIKLESLEQTFKRSKNTFFSFKEDLSMIF